MAARTLFGAEIASTTGKAKETQCHKCGNVFMADSLFCRHCGSKREEVPVQQSAPQISSPIHMLTEEEQGQILVERKIEAFRQLAANLDAQVIDQIVDEHNRRCRKRRSLRSLSTGACSMQGAACLERARTRRLPGGAAEASRIFDCLGREGSKAIRSSALICANARSGPQKSLLYPVGCAANDSCYKPSGISFRPDGYKSRWSYFTG